jgi:D-beta-D-heptose 7-phosphate kinase/D-beta-D-heptose 1-phosphate adenosyltransferase
LKNLIELIDRWKPGRVVVVGDFMLDHAVFGNCDRISPDAPVPILSVEREEFRPGGASNVCIDLAALECTVAAIGVVGDDEAGKTLSAALADAGCSTTGLIVAKDRPTTLKRSYIGLAQHRHPQKMFRADIESKDPIDEKTRWKIIDQIEKALTDADVLCIEDYNKGVLSLDLTAQVIELAHHAKVPVLVDPAAIEDYKKYRGATAITPNRTEAALATGLAVETDEQITAAAEQLLDDLDLEAVILTLDKSGALLLERNGKATQVPTVARGVYDVSGAGDMVLAALTAARVNGASWYQATELANVAAGLEVERFGVVPIPLEEIHLALMRDHGRALGKVRPLEMLLSELKAHRKMGHQIVLTNGCFDILHAGHVELLRLAAEQGDVLVLAVNSDQSISALKGANRPIVPQAERVRVLSAIECVDMIVLFGDGSGGDADTPIPLLEQIRPDVLVKGGTYAHDEVVGWELVESYGGKIVTIPPVEGLSTTNIVERIRNEA